MKTLKNSFQRFIFKGLFLIILFVSTALLVQSCCCANGNYKYVIRQDGYTYTTNQINGSGGCISFIDLSDEDKHTLCGSYSIEENKNYDPNKK